MTDYPLVSPYVAGLGGKCPRCGKGALFEGYLSLRKACDVCGLDYGRADSADGPAVFIIFIAGFFAVGAAFIARFVWFAPIWLAFLISASVALGLTFLLLRPFKATFIALQFVNNAAEGRLEENQTK